MRKSRCKQRKILNAVFLLFFVLLLLFEEHFKTKRGCKMFCNSDVRRRRRGNV